MKKILLSTLLMSIFLSLFAQKGTDNQSEPVGSAVITGKVLHKSDKQAIAFANVAVYALPDSVLVTGGITNDKGEFVIKNIPRGKYYVVADFIGFGKEVINDIEIDGRKKVQDCGVIYLKEAAIGIDEVTVTAEKNMVKYSVDKKTINVSKKLTAQGGTVVNALENTPSIQVDAEGNVLLRGSSDFVVLVDGKPSNLEGSDALKQIPASAVENVEIITNPGVKYDPDGTSGIINIIMKKNYSGGLNGMVNTSLGTQWKRSADFDLNYRTEKVNYFMNGNYADRPSYPTSRVVTTANMGEYTKLVIQEADRRQGNANRAIKGGFDYYLNDKNTLRFLGEHGYINFYLNMATRVHEYTQPASSENFFVNNGDLGFGGVYTNLNTSWDHDFDNKGHQLAVSAIYSKWDGLVKSSTESTETDDSFTNYLSTNEFQSLQSDDETRGRLKMDYTWAINENNKLEAGYQGRYKLVNSVYGLENKLENKWVSDPEFDNGMQYKRNLQSVYTNFSGTMAGMGIQLGLRAEYTDRLLSVSSNSDYAYQKLDLFPSVHISKQFESQTQIQASYSRRINRPSEWALNPFPVYSDNYMSQMGNPNLLPEFTNSFEINTMQRFDLGFVAIEGYFRETNNAFEQTFSLTDEGVMKIETHNLDKSLAYGAELSSNLNLAKWFTVYASANIYSLNVSGAIVTENIDTQGLSSDLVLNTNFVRKNTRLQLTGFYNSPRVSSQGKRAQMYGMNAALSHQFVKQNLTVSVRANNVLNTMKFNIYAQSTNAINDISIFMEYPVVMFNLSYRINNYKQRKQDDIENDFGQGLM